MNKILSFAPALGILVFGQAVADDTYTYTVENSSATITGFTAAAEPSGAIVVPATVDGYAVTGIAPSAFKGRTPITRITFASGASIAVIGAAAFQGCTGLQTIDLPAGITSIPVGLLQGCTSLTSATLPAAVGAIGSAAFADCRSLVSLDLPAGLTTLGASAFLNCRSLTSLSIPGGVTSLPDQLCYECRALTSIDLPAGLTQIGDSAFYNCTGLTSFALPAATTSVGRDAFHGCSGLTTFEINRALTSIGEQAFAGCSALTSLAVASENTTYSSRDGVLFDQAQTSLLLSPAGKAGSYTIPSTVTALAQGAFAHCHALTDVTIPASVTNLAEDAFYYATGLASVTISDGIASIGSWAFAGCSGLTSVILPESVTGLGDDAFHASSGLGWALFQGAAPAMGTTVFDSADDDFTVYYYAGQTGFSSPRWWGYPAVALEIPPSFVAWLTDNGFTPATNMLSDPDSDGVSLLLAYALDLDPSLNLAGSLPRPVLTTDRLSLTFHGNRGDVAYSAETSTDLETWEEVDLSDPDANGWRTAEVATGHPARFMRIVVGY